jgi:hypothetical protein
LGSGDNRRYLARLFTVLTICVIIVTPSMIARSPNASLNGGAQATSSVIEPSPVRVDPALRALIANPSNGSVKVIVLLRDQADMKSINTIIGDISGLRIITTFKIIPAALVDGPLSRITRLFSVKEISSVYLNKIINVVPLNVTSSPVAAASHTPVWMEAIDLPSLNVANGTGVKISIADSGVNASVPDLLGRVVASASFVSIANGYPSNEPETSDDLGHGTYVAGIAAGSGALNPEYRGVAPDAKLLNARCIDSLGEGTTAGIIEAIDWSVNNSANVINLSLGGGSADPDDPLSLAADNAARSGVVVVAAAGNGGPYYSTGEVPAAARLAISVGAYNSSNSIASFSSRGPTLDGRPYPDLIAPGVSIWSILTSNSSIASYASRLDISSGGYIPLDGTSAATPFVSGAAALLLSAAGLSFLNSSYLPSQSKVEIPSAIRIALIDTARSIGADVNTQGSGLIDVSSAYSYLLGFGNRLHYPILEVSPRQLINPPYFAGFIGDSLSLGVSVLTAFKTNLDVVMSGNATSMIELSNTTLSNIDGFAALYVNLSVPVNAITGRYVAQIGFENTTMHTLISSQNVTVDFTVRSPKGRLYFDLFHTDSSFSTMCVLFELASTLRNLGYSVYEGNQPITYSGISQYDVLILTDPMITFGLEEVNAVQRFVENNGSLLVLGNYYPGFVAEKVNVITAKYGIQFTENLIANYADLVFAKAITSMIDITNLSTHPITYGLSDYLYGYGSTLSAHNTAIASALSIAFTSAAFGTLPTLAVTDLFKGGRIAASGSLLFATDDYLLSSSYPGNLRLVENIFSWLLEKSNVSVEAITPTPRVTIDKPFQVGLAVTNRTTGMLLNSSVSCVANNGSVVPIELRNNTIGFYYNVTLEFQSQGLYVFSVNAVIIKSGLRIAKTFCADVVNVPPDVLNVTLATYNNPEYQGHLPTEYQSLLPSGTPMILRYGDYVNFTIAVSGITGPDSNVTVYLTRSPTLYLSNDKPLTYVSLEAKEIGSTIYYWAQYRPSVSNTTDIYEYWISVNNAGHISSYNSVGIIMVASIDPQIDNATTTINSSPLSSLRIPQGKVVELNPLVVYLGDTVSVVINGSTTPVVINGVHVEDDISRMKAYAILLDPDLYIVPGLISAELIISSIPFNSGTRTFEGNLSIPASGIVTLPGQSTQLSLVNRLFFILIVLVDSDGAYTTDFAGLYVLQPRQPLFPIEVIFIILGVAVAIPVVIILLLERRARKMRQEGPPPDYYSFDEPAKASP